MKKSVTLIAICLITLFSTSATFSQTVSFTFNLSPADLVTNHLVGGGIVATNITGNYLLNSGAAFTNGNNANLGFNSGIILSTGNINTVTDQSSQFTSSTLGTQGDSLLNLIVSPAITYDANIISFDFKAASDSVEFNFVFASEEYNEWVNSAYNDVFAFYVTGPGFTDNTNVALIPGTSVPIAINTVNNGGPYTGISSGPCNNCSYYVDNVAPGSGVNPVLISYDGLTTVIKIKFAVWPCSDYHFKIAIADVADGVYDSAVLLEENTFVACPQIQVTNNGMVAPTTVTICSGGSTTLTAPEGPAYFWSTGESTQSITVTQPGVYQCMYSVGSCFAFTNNVQVVQQGAIQTPAISQMGLNLVSNITPAPSITFQWFLDGVAIPGAVTENLLIQGNGCYQLFIYEGSCEASSNIECITNTSVYELNPGSFTITPNPVVDKSVIKSTFKSGSVTTLNVLDLSGKLLSTQNFEGGEEIILDNKFFKGGLYFIELRNNSDNEILYGKVVILN